MQSATGHAQSGLRYRPFLPLGQGGMAEVQLAVGRGPGGFNKLVVLKTMRKELAPDGDLRRMFLAEALLSARLNHANVVQVYEVVDSTLPCIVMEYLEGQPLSVIQQVGGERFTTAMQLRVISDALAGLHYSHELRDYDGTPLNIVHRDVSPQNVFVTYDGRVKVLDFGVAKAANVAEQTRTGIIKGKLTYMPREQMLGEDLDRRADIYAVGCMLWQAAAGVKLWGGTAERDVMRRLLEGAIPKPSVVRPVDERLERIVMKALAVDPDERYSTALELQTVIDQYLSDTRSGNSMRDVAGFVSELFASQRSDRSKSIHTTLSTPNLELASIQSVVEDEPESDSSSGLRALDGLQAGTKNQPLPHSKSRLFWFVALMAALVLAGVYLGRQGLTRGAPVAAAPAPSPPRSIQLRISIEPRDASATIDGKVLNENPALLDVLTDKAEHEIRALSPGHVPFVRTIRFERDTSLEIALEKIDPLPVMPPTTSEPSSPARKTGRGRARVAPPAPVPSAKAPEPVAVKKGACDPPFYFAGKIKKFKPECL